MAYFSPYPFTQIRPLFFLHLLHQVNLLAQHNVMFCISFSRRLDLQHKPVFVHRSAVVDALAQPCNAARHANNHLRTTTTTTTTVFSSTPPNESGGSSTMHNDYERRLHRSLQKLTIPAWYKESTPLAKQPIKSSTISLPYSTRESQRTLEIVHVRRPRSNRSCRSSLTTSPSPSVHSWHPNHMIDGVNFSPVLPSSSSHSRRRNKYEKGSQRVAKLSQWYQPAQFAPTKKNDQNGR